MLRGSGDGIWCWFYLSPSLINVYELEFEIRQCFGGEGKLVKTEKSFEKHINFKLIFYEDQLTLSKCTPVLFIVVSKEKKIPESMWLISYPSYFASIYVQPCEVRKMSYQ